MDYSNMFIKQEIALLAQSVERVTLKIYFGRIKVITRLGVRAPRRAYFYQIFFN